MVGSAANDTAGSPASRLTDGLHSNQNEVVRAKTTLNGLSLGLLVVAGVLWTLVWCRSRVGHPYRYVSFMVIVVSATSCHVTGLAVLLVDTPTGVACRSVVVANALANLILYTFVLLHAVLSVAVAMRRLSSGPRFYFIVLVALVMPLLIVGVETSLDLIFHPDTPCLFYHLSNAYHWFTRAPKTILLLGAMCVVTVLFYWLFCFDNEVFKRNRDFLLIRHGSVTLFILIFYCLFLEVDKLVYLDMATSDRYPWDLMRYGTIMELVESSRGLVIAMLLCFLDLEILSIVLPGCPCVPDLREIDLDDSWESRIRRESFIRFSSSKEDNMDSCNDACELRPQGKVKYGTLVEDACAEEVDG